MYEFLYGLRLAMPYAIMAPPKPKPKQIKKLKAKRNRNQIPNQFQQAAGVK